MPMPVLSTDQPRPRTGPLPWLLIAGLFSAGCATYTPQTLVPQTMLANLERITLNDALDPNRTADPGSEHPSPFNLQDGLNPDEAGIAAVLLNPGLREHLAAVGLADGDLLDAGLWPNPEFAADLRQAMQSSAKSVDVGLSFELLRWEERSARTAEAEAAQAAARHALLAAASEVALDARTRWWEAVAARERLRLNAEELALTEKLLQHLRAKQDHGAATALDLNLALLEKVQVQLDGLRLQKEAATAERALREAIGLPPAAALDLQIPSQPFAVTARSEIDTYAAALPRLLQAPTLQAAAAEYAVAENALRGAIARQYPGLRMGPAATLEYDGEWTTLLGAVLSFDLPLWNRNQGEILSKSAARDRQRASYTTALHRLRAALAEADGALQSSRATLAFLDREVLPPAREFLRLSEAAYAAGQADVLEMLKAQSAAIAIYRQVLEIQIEDRLLLEAFQRALGQPAGLLSSPTPAAPSDSATQPSDNGIELFSEPLPAQP